MDIHELAKSFLPCHECALAASSGTVNMPSTAQVAATLDRLFALLYPGCHDSGSASHARCRSRVEELFVQIAEDLEGQIRQVLACSRAGAAENSGETDIAQEARALTEKFLAELPNIRAVLQEDVVAAYEGDPAATCREEIIMAYPAFEAMSVFRVAHELYALGVPMLPRMMTEYAHSRTGIDIHPGATIGEYFFIDHGTGVVIGETTVIGDHVKLYHGVTLGAKSFEVNPDGSLVKGVKRHPNIGSRVVIYAGATILGGDTTIGDGCVIGGNVWLTHSVPAGKTIIAAHERVAEEESPKPASPQTSVDVFM